jgi:methionyl-tRNA synthetase
MTASKILVAVGWPYAQGSLHLGHLAGAYLPADIFARYHRAAGDDVLMVSGSDQHGTPITVRADQEGVTPQEIVDRYHPEFLDNWERLGVSWDLFTTTGTENHRAVVHDIFLRLLENGYLYKAVSRQPFDPEENRFLPDRYVEGTCPHCAYDAARGDQCDNCGRTLDPQELIAPRSRLTGVLPEFRNTEHFYLKLTALNDRLLEWLKGREGWRPHVINFAVGFVQEGLHDRAITRDLDWGIDIPVPDLGDGKRIYVWFEAVIGYLSASKEWAQLQGDPEAWRAWWEDPEARSYYFIGKDNIPFHAIIWPAILMGYGGLNLPTDVPANQFVTFKGEKASKSAGVGKTVSWYLEHFEPDALRYAIASHLPEQSDADLFEAELVRSINEELVANWGNLVNRVVAMSHRYFDGVIPPADASDERDAALLARIDAALEEEAGLIERVHLRAGLVAAMTAARDTNAYLSEREPWKTAATDPARTAATLHTALSAIGGINVGLAPYLPFSSQRVHETLGLAGAVTAAGWARPRIDAGTVLGEAKPLFAKIEAGADDGDE